MQPGQYLPARFLPPFALNGKVNTVLFTTALEVIQAKLIEVAKEKIFDPDKSLNEIAYELGFKYPQHFTRLFKNKVGHTPKEYRMMN